MAAGGVINGDGITLRWDNPIPNGIDPYVIQPTVWKPTAPIMLVCPICFAEVQAHNAKRHEDWHDALNAMLEKAVDRS